MKLGQITDASELKGSGAAVFLDHLSPYNSNILLSNPSCLDIDSRTTIHLSVSGLLTEGEIFCSNLLLKSSKAT